MKFNTLYNSLVSEEAYSTNKEYVLIILFDGNAWCKKIFTDAPKEELLEYCNIIYNKTGREGKVCTSVDDIKDSFAYSTYETVPSQPSSYFTSFTAIVISSSIYESYLKGLGLTEVERAFIDSTLKTVHEIQFQYTPSAQTHLSNIVIDGKMYPTMKDAYDDFARQSFKGHDLEDLMNL